MLCLLCTQNAVIASPQFCKEHFCNWVVAVIKQTIKNNNLIPDVAKVGVAVSGGKDSMVLLATLHKLGYDVTALCVDEGIAAYRANTLAIAKAFCETSNIPMKVLSFKEMVHESLDTFLKTYTGVPCRACGAWRRAALNELAQGFAVIATGHNLDDEAQTVFMNLVHNQPSLNARIGPRVGTTELTGYVQRIKPLFWLSERQIKAYAFLENIPVDPAACPHQGKSFRAAIRDMLNRIELASPQIKLQLMLHALQQHPVVAVLQTCTVCALPCASSICRSCALQKEIVQ